MLLPPWAPSQGSTGSVGVVISTVRGSDARTSGSVGHEPSFRMVSSRVSPCQATSTGAEREGDGEATGSAAGRVCGAAHPVTAHTRAGAPTRLVPFMQPDGTDAASAEPGHTATCNAPATCPLPVCQRVGSSCPDVNQGRPHYGNWLAVG